MADLLLTSIEYSGYISPLKFIVFLVLFLAWLPLTDWVYRDARAVGTKEVLWAAIIFGTGAAATMIWLITPVFIIGTLLYLIAVGTTSVSYVIHRNTKVAEYNRLLTAEHIKSLFVSEAKSLDTLKKLLFITANNNEVPIPQPKTPDFLSYKAAYDVFTDATWRRASDIILSPTQQDYGITYYIDGIASKQPAIPRENVERFIRFLKNLADMDPDEKRKPQKGKFKIQKDTKYTGWEAITAGSTAGEQVQIKQITQQEMGKLTDIGLTTDQYEQLNMVCEAKRGLFIVAGVPKSGVTTTLYAMLRKHDPYLFSINTLEREPSAELTNITQNVFTLSDTGTTTYAKKLQSVIRMGSDIVGVADCADNETAQTACWAAKSGKVVYVTLEAENVIQALGKWIKLIGDRSVIAETLLGISNQRLLRKLCNECKEAYEPNKELLKKFNIPAEKTKVFYRAPKERHDKHGKPIICGSCQGTGFVGRICVFELITINDELRRVIQQSKSLSEIGTEFRRAKMLYLQEQAMKKVIDGTTAINEMVRVLSSEKKQKTETTEEKA